MKPEGSLLCSQRAHCWALSWTRWIYSAPCYLVSL